MPDKTFEILLVEDNPSDVELLNIALTESQIPFHMQICEDGEVALETLRNQRLPGLVVLDLNLPKKSGREVLDEIRNEKALKDIPVAVFSTSAHEREIKIISAYPHTKYFTKPSRYSEYQNIVQALHDFSTSVS